MLRMGESIKKMLQGPCLMMMEPYSKSLDHHWVNMEDDEDHTDNNALSSSTTSSSLENSATSNETSSSLEHSSSTSYEDVGPLYELSELMAQLPIKRGLSKYFQGKSQSFTSLSRVESVEDLAKKETPPYRRKKKASKRYGGGLDAHKPYTLLPKATISKKTSKDGSFSSFSNSHGRLGSFLGTCNTRPPQIPPQNNLREIHTKRF